MVESKALPEMGDSVEKVNDLLASLGYPYKLAVVSYDDLELLEKNARYMEAGTFQNLVQNLRRDGGLESVPFCWKRSDGKYEVLSGNHRVSAGVEAAKTGEIPGSCIILFTDKELSREERVAKQLAHNAIEGKDDQAILRELYEEIQNVELRYYSGIDDKELGALPEISLESLVMPNMDFAALSILFLPEEVEKIDSAFDDAKAMAGSSDAYHIVRLREYEKTLAALQTVKTAYNIKNSAVAFMVILEVFRAHQTDLEDGWLNEDPDSKQMVPLSTIFGDDQVPVGVAHELKKVVGRMTSRQEIEKGATIDALRIMAEQYLTSRK